jgi:hypothetical protein
MEMDDVLKKYQRGIKELLLLLKDHYDAYHQVEALKEELISNLESVGTFGDNDRLKQARKPILEKLNNISYEMLNQSFNKVCGLTEVEINDYRQDFRVKVITLYKSLGFQVLEDFSEEKIRADFLMHYVMPLNKSYTFLIKSVVTVEDLIGKEIVERFASALETAREQGLANFGEMVTDLGFTPEAIQAARQSNIQLLTYNDCVNTLINFNNYINRFILDYESYNEFKEGRRQSFLDILENCDLKNHFINPDFSDSNGNLFTSIDSYIETWLKKEKQTELVILSDPDHGKTSVALHLTYELAKKYQTDPAKNRIPIIIPLKDYGKFINPKQMLTSLLVNHYSLNFSSYSAFDMLLRNGKFILIFDGFDEISLNGNISVAYENFIQLKELMVRNGRSILTCDTNFLLQQKFAESIFTSKKVSDTKKYQPEFEIIFLQEFDGKHITDFLKARTQNWQAFYIKIKSMPELFSLARFPFILEMMWQTLVQVIREKKPFNFSSFYEIFTGLWMDTEDEDSIMSPPDKAIFLEELALEMLRKRQLFLHNSELPGTIREVFKEFLRDYSESEVFAYDAGTCPFLVQDLDGNYKLKHKSLVDFFIAKKYIRSLRAGELHDFHQIELPFEVKNFIVELMPQPEKEESEIHKDMVKIPSGKATHPFWLDKYPVTNGSYAEFIKATNFNAPSHWKHGNFPRGKKNHPVVNVSWQDAVLYAKWCGKRLPTKSEWEKASGFEDGRQYPWGNDFNPNACNSIESRIFDTTPVDNYPENLSPCGCVDMAGNTWEWTCSWVDEKRKDNGYVAKGGSFFSDYKNVSSEYGLNSRELNISISEAIGFRCAI